MKSPFSKIAVAIGLFTGSGLALGMGFGQAVTHRAIFGLPLDMSVSVKTVPGERFDPACVHADVHFGEARVHERQVRVDISRVHAEERMVRIRTTVAIDEPVVSVNVSAGCEAAVARKIVAFADPPPGSLLPDTGKAAVAGASSSSAGRPRSPSPASEAASQGALVATEQSGKRVVDIGALLAGADAEGSAASNKPAQPPKKRLAALDGGEASARISPAADAGASASATARLKLDPPRPANLPVNPTLKLSDGVSSLDPDESLDDDRRAAASSLWRVMNATPEELASQQTRLAQLEVDLGRLKKDADQAGVVVNELRSRLADSEQRQSSNPLMYALAAVVLALAGGMVMLMRRRVQPEEAQDSWWAPSEQGVGEGFPGDSLYPAGDAGEALDPRRVPVAGAVEPPSVAAPRKDMVVASGIEVSSPLADDWAQAAAGRSDAGVVGIDQLYDLEKQVGFYRSLGQDEAAVDLLSHHVQSPGAVSPMPFLKLFELYQALGSRSAFDSLADDFVRRFGVSAPSWSDDLTDVHGLADYPEWVEPLVKAWEKPQQALDVLLDGLLHRHGGSLLDEPAYSDLLTLALVARDRIFEHQVFQTESAPGVDLELPLDDHAPAPFSSSLVQPMLATSPLHVQMDVAKTLPLSIDLELETLGSEPSTPGSRSHHV